MKAWQLLIVLGTTALLGGLGLVALDSDRPIAQLCALALIVIGPLTILAGLAVFLFSGASVEDSRRFDEIGQAVDSTELHYRPIGGLLFIGTFAGLLWLVHSGTEQLPRVAQHAAQLAICLVLGGVLAIPKARKLIISETEHVNKPRRKRPAALPIVPIGLGIMFVADLAKQEWLPRHTNIGVLLVGLSLMIVGYGLYHGNSLRRMLICVSLIIGLFGYTLLLAWAIFHESWLAQLMMFGSLLFLAGLLLNPKLRNLLSSKTGAADWSPAPSEDIDLENDD
jgi:hypothetical protein